MDVEHAKDLLLREREEISRLQRQVVESGGLDKSEEEATGEFGGVDQHLADHASEMFEREKDMSIEDGLIEKLGEIDAALQRIEDDEFGMCLVCGRPIDDERLEAVPATRFCREHAGTGRLDEGPDTEISQEINEF